MSQLPLKPPKRRSLLDGNQPFTPRATSGAVSIDGPGSALASFDNSDITKVGASLDRKFGDLLTVLDVEASATPALAVVSPSPRRSAEPHH
jgi:hypothetical protein